MFFQFIFDSLWNAYEEMIVEQTNNLGVGVTALFGRLKIWIFNYEDQRIGKIAVLSSGGRRSEDLKFEDVKITESEDSVTKCEDSEADALWNPLLQAVSFFKK